MIVLRAGPVADMIGRKRVNREASQAGVSS